MIFSVLHCQNGEQAQVRFIRQRQQPGKRSSILLRQIFRKLVLFLSLLGLLLGFVPQREGVRQISWSRDVNQGLRLDTDTVFNICSVCKGLTALAISCLVTDGEVCWVNRAQSFLDDHRHSNFRSPTIRDLLSHRTGFCRSDSRFIRSKNQLLLLKPQEMSSCRGCTIEKASSPDYGNLSPIVSSNL